MTNTSQAITVKQRKLAKQASENIEKARGRARSQLWTYINHADELLMEMDRRGLNEAIQTRHFSEERARFLKDSLFLLDHKSEAFDLMANTQDMLLVDDILEKLRA